MLVLSRKVDEKIHIGDNITITIVRIGESIVRLGFDAPDDINIRRAELGAFDPNWRSRNKAQKEDKVDKECQK